MSARRPAPAAQWALAAAVAPSSTVLVALLTAFLGGSVPLDTFKEELPEGRRPSSRWFLLGLALCGVLLAVVTALSE